MEWLAIVICVQRGSARGWSLRPASAIGRRGPLECASLQSTKACRRRFAGAPLKLSSFFLYLGSFIAAVVVALISWAYYLSWDVARWDKKIEALCAANGGADVATKVYETAVAPETPEYFSGTAENRYLGVLERPYGVKYGPNYPYVIETRVTDVINEKNPTVVRFTAKLIRVDDEKVLAERSGYQRSGGGFAIFGSSDGRTCPVDRPEDRLEIKVFINHPNYVEGNRK